MSLDLQYDVLPWELEESIWGVVYSRILTQVEALHSGSCVCVCVLEPGNKAMGLVNLHSFLKTTL